MNEAHVQHLVSFIENQNLDIAQADRALTHQVEQPSRRCHENMTALLKIADLLVDFDPAKHGLRDAIHEF